MNHMLRNNMMVMRQLSSGNVGKKIKGDSEFVVRRRVYRDEMHNLRVKMWKQVEDMRKDEGQELEIQKKQQEERRLMKLEKKRKQSEQKRLAGMKIQQERSRMRMERDKVKTEIWERRQKERKEKKEMELKILEEASQDWITDDNLEMKLDQVMDAFFIEPAYDGNTANKVRVKGW